MESTSAQAAKTLQVQVYRGHQIESVHQVHLVVLNDKNEIVESFGNPDYKTFPRSAIKLMQAIPFVKSGAIEKYNLSEKEIVLACASHQAEDFHLQALYQWSEKMGIQENDLACGPHWSAHTATADEMKKKNLKPTKWTNNCSGKHLGLIATALMKQEKIKDYHLIQHPVQQRIIQTLKELTGIQSVSNESFWAIDGCGIPTGHFPLKNWVQGLSVFFSSQNVAPRESAVSENQIAAQKILSAIQKYPEYLGGSQNLSSDMIRLTEGRMIVKSGAEAFFLGFWPMEKLSFGFKVEDGSARAVPAILKYLAKKYVHLSENQTQLLDKNFSTEMTNTLGQVVGRVELKF